MDIDNGVVIAGETVGGNERGYGGLMVMGKIQ